MILMFSFMAILIVGLMLTFADDGSFATLAVVLLLFGVVGFLYGAQSEAAQSKKHFHTQVVKDLTSEGWKGIKSHDVHWNSETVDIGCFNLKVKKIVGKYKVVTKRPAGDGGGWNVWYPHQKLFVIYHNQIKVTC